MEVKNPADRPLFVHAYVFKDDESQVAWNRDIFYVKSIVPKVRTVVSLSGSADGQKLSGRWSLNGCRNL